MKIPEAFMSPPEMADTGCLRCGCPLERPKYYCSECRVTGPAHQRPPKDMRINCWRCGKEFTKRYGNSRYCSAECRIPQRPCMECGKPMEYRMIKYCKACAPAMVRKLNREWHRRHDEPPKPRNCQRCGVAVHKRGQKWCEACLPVVVKAQHRLRYERGKGGNACAGCGVILEDNRRTYCTNECARAHGVRVLYVDGKKVPMNRKCQRCGQPAGRWRSKWCAKCAEVARCESQRRSEERRRLNTRKLAGRG